MTVIHKSLRGEVISKSNIRDVTGVCTHTFKRNRDGWLRDIVDEPATPGYSSSQHNSLSEIGG